MIIQIKEEYNEGQLEDKLLENPFAPVISLHRNNMNLKIVALGGRCSDVSRVELLN